MARKKVTQPASPFPQYHFPSTTGELKCPAPRRREYPPLVEIASPDLYDLQEDIGETRNLAAERPKVVERLLTFADRARDDLGDFNRIGKGMRFYDGPAPRTADDLAPSGNNEARFEPSDLELFPQSR